VVRQLLEGSTDAAVVLTNDRRLVYHNAVYERYCSMRPRELARAVSEGAHCYDVFPIEVCQAECVLNQAQKAGRPIRMDEIHAKRADGEELTLIVTAAPLGDGFTVETYRDVTADARMQANYKELLKAEREARENLEKEVDQRTEELRRANEELKRAQAMLIHQETMSSLGRLVAGIAHELNNPINFVYGNIDFMEEYMERLMRLVDFYEELTGPEHPHLDRIQKIREEIEYDGPTLPKCGDTTWSRGSNPR
jgi:signal transduction histidine kinase